MSTHGPYGSPLSLYHTRPRPSPRSRPHPLPPSMFPPGRSLLPYIYNARTVRARGSEWRRGGGWRAIYLQKSAVVDETYRRRKRTPGRPRIKARGDRRRARTSRAPIPPLLEWILRHKYWSRDLGLARRQCERGPRLPPRHAENTPPVAEPDVVPPLSSRLPCTSWMKGRGNEMASSGRTRLISTFTSRSAPLHCIASFNLSSPTLAILCLFFFLSSKIKRRNATVTTRACKKLDRVG